MTTSVIYKICTEEEWQTAKEDGVYKGAPIDLKDGFIHFSSSAQVKETAAKHFANVNNLLLIAVDVEKLDSSLKWEPSRGGDLFPHLYSDLDLNTIIWEKPLKLNERGKHAFPEDL